MIDKSSCPIPNVPKDFSSVSFMDLDDVLLFIHLFKFFL